MTLQLPVRCSANWAMKPLTLGAGQLWVHMFLWKKWVLMIYEIYHIWTVEMKWKWSNDRCSQRNLCNCVKKSEKKKGSKPIRSNGTIPTTSFLRIFCIINDVMCHALWHHLLSLPYQFSTFEDVLGWQSWVMYMWLTFLICKHVTYMHVKVDNYRLSATFIVETHDPSPLPPFFYEKFLIGSPLICRYYLH